MDTKPLRILLWGPLPIENDVLGGTKVSFANLVHFMEGVENVKLRVINTSRALAGRGRAGRLWANATAFVKSTLSLLLHSRHCDVVMINISAPAAIRIVWFLLFITKGVWGKPTVLRFFGGDMHDVLLSASGRERRRFMAALQKADLVYLETLVLMDKLGESCTAKHLPTTRNMPPRTRPVPSQCRRALFLSQVKRSKGIPEILEASNKVSFPFEFTIAGPMFDCAEYVDDPTYPSVRIMPPIPIKEVPALLESHDVLLLPSKRRAEGYPGVVIEAMQLGLPAIVTELDRLAEIVVDGHNGYLVPLGDSTAIGRALDRMAADPGLFAALQENAMKTGARYRDKTVMKGVLSDLETFAGGR